jgi:hypothetical protein
LASRCGSRNWLVDRPLPPQVARSGYSVRTDAAEFGFISDITLQCLDRLGRCGERDLSVQMNAWHHVMAVRDGSREGFRAAKGPFSRTCFYT